MSAAKPNEYRAPRLEELEAVARHIAESFVRGFAWGVGAVEGVGAENLRVLVAPDGTILSGTILHRMGQFFGGRRLGTLGPGALFVTPEARGHGVALELLRHILTEARTAGVPLSTLYPASRQLYGRAGYGLAGARVSRLLEASRVGVRRPGLPVRRAREDEQPALRALHAAVATRTNGWLDRTDYKWRSLFDSGDELRTVYVADGASGPEGYVVLSVMMRNEQRLVQVEDAVAATPAAVHALLAFAAGHAFQAHGILWHGGTADPFEAVLRENVARVDRYMEWYVRVADVKGALETRGYPVALACELHLDVRDDWFAENNGPHRVTLAGGRAQVVRGGTGRVRLSVAALATLLAGARSARELALLGQLEGPDEDIDLLAAVFAGPTPSMNDMF
ncbi:MAG: GNAT family N-acetyltransferase [Candidatus Sumerlaeia bacterium]|nr:GNAT family N-acetyltransferase [Candidatus Sumerlaeia bacterium]